MDFKCDQEFVLMSCECADRLFPFLANMAAIITICRFFRRETKKSPSECENILGDVLMRGMHSEQLPEHV